ncbi:MAG TPA: late competence development ComFB family protein [Gemmatimonadaceae bacterium]|nr:late competence development ComFB family protein [Gemmatimonadaceae bacterium]
MKNRVETIIGELYDELRRANPEFCGCEHCREDVLTYTLNQAQPRYSGTATGQALISVDLQSDQRRAELSVIVLDAMRRVAANPRHTNPRAAKETK